MVPAPSVPRPPQPQLDAVLPDLATYLANVAVQEDTYVARDVLVQSLSNAHFRPAIEWALYLLIECGLMREGSVEQTVRHSDPSKGISEIRSHKIEVEAVQGTREFWAAWRSNRLSIHSQSDAQRETASDSGADLHTHIALCLSGGGFRATLYHLGVIRYLRDAGLLTKVRHICAVSGGSIAAAHIVRHWAGYTSAKDETFDGVAEQLIDFVKLDVRGRIVRRLPYSMFYKGWRRSSLIRNMYAKLYATRPEEPRTPPPKLHLLATNLTLGCLCSFEGDRIILYQKEGPNELLTSTLTDAVKVTVSSAFPAFFPPVALTADELGVDKEGYLPDIQYFTDGGVYDNLGIRRLQQLVQDTDPDPERRLALLLVSDAGRPFGFDLTRTMPGIIKTAWRSNDIALARIGELDQRELSHVFDRPSLVAISVPSRFRILSIADEVPFTQGGNTLPLNLQKLVKAIRTDLDCFTDQEIIFLVQHGYACARHSLTGLADECRTACTDHPLVRLMRDARPVPNGRWLPPKTDPGWPRDKDLTAWDNDPDKVKLTQSIARLRHSGDIRLRLFSLSDRVSTVSMLVALVIFAALAVVGWNWLMAPSQPIPEIVYSRLGGDLDTSLFPIDPSMPGIEILERLVEVDLRNEVAVPEKDRDVLRVSPSVHTYTIKGVRNSTDSRYLIYEFSSQRKLMDAVCISPHPFQVRYRQDQAPGGDGFDNVYTMIVDLNQHSPDIPFTVIFRVTRWNAYQAPNKNYVGALVSGDENLIRLSVLLPIGRKFVSATLEERPQQKGAKWTPVSEERAVQPIAFPDRTGFNWTLSNPRKDWAHRAMIDWE